MDSECLYRRVQSLPTPRWSWYVFMCSLRFFWAWVLYPQAVHEYTVVLKNPVFAKMNHYSAIHSTFTWCEWCWCVYLPGVIGVQVCIYLVWMVLMCVFTRCDWCWCVYLPGVIGVDACSYLVWLVLMRVVTWCDWCWCVSLGRICVDSCNHSEGRSEDECPYEVPVCAV